MKYLLLLIVVMGCTSSQLQTQDPLVYYKNDLSFKFEGDKYFGPTVLPYREEYELTFIGHDRIHFFIFTTCARQVVIEKNKKKHKIIYRPELEKGKVACPAYVAAFSKSGRHAQTVIMFEDPRYDLEATQTCNGSKSREKGVSICETKEGLLARLEFDEEVTQGAAIKGSPTRRPDVGACPKLPTKDNKTFNYMVANRECYNIFIGKKSRKKYITLNIGHEQVAVRE